MSVVAKFRVASVTDFGYSKEIKLSAVYEGELGPNEENRRFAKATPNGSLTMTVDNPYASDQFGVGGEFYLHFVPVDKEKEAFEKIKTSS